jgi:hypothetical protein
VEIYIASVAAALSTLVLATVYLADRYEREPIERIQNTFLTGLLGQLIVILSVSVLLGQVQWTGWWMWASVIAVAVYLPLQLRHDEEVDEVFDGIVYAVALVAGVACTIHINDLPQVIRDSPYSSAFVSGAAPDLRDVMIVATSAGLASELGEGLVLILCAVAIGWVTGLLLNRGWRAGRIVAVSVFSGIVILAIDQLTAGHPVTRLALFVLAVALAVAVKRRSVFRDRPQASESAVVTMALKTVLMILGGALLVMVLLQAVVDQPAPPGADLTSGSPGPAPLESQ